MKQLHRTQFGNPILRQTARRLSRDEIFSDDIQQLIAGMRDMLTSKKFGVGVAAPQVGQNVAISVIGIKPTPTRPDNEVFDMVIINPEIVKTYGTKTPKWEGCLSFGGTRNFPYAQVPRYQKIRLRWTDEQGIEHEEDLTGLPAHVAQHEVDHLNGILFVDRVKDTKSYMTASEYRRRYLRKSRT